MIMSALTKLQNATKYYESFRPLKYLFKFEQTGVQPNAIFWVHNRKFKNCKPS